MKKASFILMALALVAMLFTGCTTQQIVSGSTFTVKDSFTNSDGEIEEILTSEVFFVFAKDGTGTMKATNTYGSSEDFSTCNNYMNFKWLTDDSACTVTITASSYTEGDYTIDDSIVLVGTLENNTLSFEFDQNDIETNVYIVEFVFATYKKWYAATFDEYGLDYSKWPKLTISLTK